MPDDAAQTLSDMFRILGDPTRVRILDVLTAGELCVCDLAELVGISESAASHQLRLMRGMRLVRPASGRPASVRLDRRSTHPQICFKQALRHVTEERRRVRPDATVCEVHAESIFKVEGMDCHEEVAILQRRLTRLSGLEALDADVLGQRLRISMTPRS